jgi:hypothetical protein
LLTFCVYLYVGISTASRFLEVNVRSTVNLVHFCTFDNYVFILTICVMFPIEKNLTKITFFVDKAQCHANTTRPRVVFGQGGGEILSLGNKVFIVLTEGPSQYERHKQ